MIQYLIKTALAAALAFFALLAIAQEPLVFDSAEQEERYKELTVELRCAVCQNQNLADSDAPLAQDLRQEIYKMMQAGKSDDQIKQFMVERYGDFVLYRPPVKGNTLALWLLPGILLGVGAIVVFFTVRNRNRRLAAQSEEGS
ncbi:MAG: cytochrome c-type biogenesis protein [Xanthomonadales bacterium]|nr:cytochrome c-type biogenesis protein [Xanthomonadales bacterium]